MPLALLLAASLARADAPVFVDSAMTEAEAFEGISPQCPPAVRARQRLVPVTYWGFDGRAHAGQIVVDQDLVKDIQAVFALALQEKFPIQSVVPISHPRYRKKGVWDDDVSMALNNTSGFNYRLVSGGTTLSNHATGRAVDINPLLNPYIRVKGKPLPPGSVYDKTKPGTILPGTPITREFLKRGWGWGGDWTHMKDYQHFEKPE